MDKLRKLHLKLDSSSAVELPFEDLKQVRELVLENAKAAHLQSVQGMPRLTKLSVDGLIGDAADIAPGSSKLTWLRVVSVDDVFGATVFSLIKAHAESLEELEVGCPSLWGYFENNISTLQASDMKALRRILLVRTPSVSHSHWSCEVQRGKIKTALDGSANTVSIICEKC